MSFGGKFDFFSRFVFENQSDFDYKAQKIRLYPFRTLKRYLNKKNLIHGRETETISKFSALILGRTLKASSILTYDNCLVCSVNHFCLC